MNQLPNEPLRPIEIALRKHQLPPLKYDYDALAPYIDSHTLMLHHDVHHGGYVTQLNAALEKFPALRECTALWLLRNLDKVPEEIRELVHHNAGGHVNHSLFWRTMKPGAVGEPKGLLLEAIKRDFGGFTAFKAQFEMAGVALFGSGWVWLVRAQQDGGMLEIITTHGHDHPLMQGKFAILLNDVWEHAYYLQYESRRLDYLRAWWSIVNWDEAGRRFELSDNAAEELWEGEGGNVLPASTTTVS